MNRTLSLTLFLLMTIVLMGSAVPATYAHSCTLNNVSGAYGYTSSGTVVSPAIGPFAAVGRVTFSASGTFSGAQTTSIGGTLVEETVSGTFTVNSDCTATATVNVYHGTTLARTTNLNLVFEDDQKSVRAIFLTTGTVITISGRRIFTED